MSKLFAITGPSGAGEDSIIKGLKEKFPVEIVITTTTREIREGESEGNSYYFISKDEFKNRIENGEFFEWAEQDRGNLYGVTKKEIERVKNTDKIGIWKVDYKGIITIKKIMPDVVVIFINVPIEQLGNRIRNRSKVTEEFIKGRLKYAEGWYQIRNLYDYEINNEDGKLKEAIEKTAEIIKKIYS